MDTAIINCDQGRCAVGSPLRAEQPFDRGPKIQPLAATKVTLTVSKKDRHPTMLAIVANGKVDRPVPVEAICHRTEGKADQVQDGIGKESHPTVAVVSACCVR